MIEQIKYPAVEDLDTKTISDEAETKRIEEIANKAAKKSSQTEKAYDQKQPIFSK